MEMDEIKKEIEEKYKVVADYATELNKALIDMRGIKFDFDKDNADEVQQVMQLGRDIDNRVAYVLRALLVQHGNVLFL